MNFDKAIDEMRDQIVSSTQEIIRIKSVGEPPLPGMPFGQGVNDAYWNIMNLGKSLGFTTLDVDNYAGHIEIGEGEEVVGVLAHLDVVPEGDGWKYPPYAAEIHDGRIYGRGTTDDKGPVVSTLYAMKALKDSGVKLNRKVRLILGLAEETTWEGVNYYFSKIKAPDMAFTPDAGFPAIYAEKGLMGLELVGKLDKKQEGNKGLKVLSIKGGTVANAVPRICVATLKYCDCLKEEEGITIVKENDLAIITSTGVAAHASNPSLGVNAISQMFMYLSRQGLAEGSIKDIVKLYAEKIGMTYNGENIGCGFSDPVSGKLTFNTGIVNMTEDEIRLKIDIRSPIDRAKEDVLAGIEKAIVGSALTLNFLKFKEPICVPEDSDLIQKLMKVYADYTGDHETKAQTMGGGTYARAMKNCVAFGPNFPGEDELAHQANENVLIDSLMLATKIYAQSLYELAK